MFGSGQPDSRTLSTGHIDLAVRRSGRGRAFLGWLVLCLALVVGGFAWWAQGRTDLPWVTTDGALQVAETPEQSLSRLQQALEQASLNHDIEVATRQELERQIATLSEQLKEAQAELAFLKSVGSSPPKTN